MESLDRVAEKVVGVELWNNNGYVTRILLDAQRRETEDCRGGDQGLEDAIDYRGQEKEHDEAVEGDHGDAEGHETQVENEEEEAGCATWWDAAEGDDALTDKQLRVQEAVSEALKTGNFGPKSRFATESARALEMLGVACKGFLASLATDKETQDKPVCSCLLHLPLALLSNLSRVSSYTHTYTHTYTHAHTGQQPGLLHPQG